MEMEFLRRYGTDIYIYHSLDRIANFVVNAKEIGTARKDVSGKEMLLRCTESAEPRPVPGETNNVCFNLTS